MAVSQIFEELCLAQPTNTLFYSNPLQQEGPTIVVDKYLWLGGEWVLFGGIHL